MQLEFDLLICPDTDLRCDFKYCNEQGRCLFEHCETISDLDSELVAAFTDNASSLNPQILAKSRHREREFWNFLLTPVGHMLHIGGTLVLPLPKAVTTPSKSPAPSFKDIFSAMSKSLGRLIKKSSSYDNESISAILGEEYSKYRNFTYFAKSDQNNRYLRKVTLPQDLALIIHEEVCHYNNDNIFLFYICKYLSTKNIYSSAWQELVLSARSNFLYHDLGLFIKYKQQALYLALYILTSLAKKSYKFRRRSVHTKVARDLALSLVEVADTLPDVDTYERYNLYHFNFDLSHDLRSLKRLLN